MRGFLDPGQEGEIIVFAQPIYTKAEAVAYATGMIEAHECDCLGIVNATWGSLRWVIRARVRRRGGMVQEHLA